MVAELSISRIVCDFAVLVTIAIPLLIFHEFVQPYKRGFYCDDETIRYPFKTSTVSRQLLIVIGILIPTTIILLTEVFRAMTWEKRCASEFGTYRCKKYNVHRFIVRLYVFIGYFFVGVCFNQLMVDIAKYTIGRLRPHFMDVCKPNVGYLNCPANEHRYITDYNCTTQRENGKLIHEAHLSFYSGHSAFSFYAAWYTSFYLQARLFRPLYSRLVIPVIQFALFMGATFVAYTRVSDYKHHWSDVLIGAVMGSIIGIVNALFFAEVFHRREIPHEFHKRRILGIMHYRSSADECLYRANEDTLDVQLPTVGRRPFTGGNGSTDAPAPLQRVVVHEDCVPGIMRPAKVEVEHNHQYRTSPYDIQPQQSHGGQHYSSR